MDTSRKFNMLKISVVLIISVCEKIAIYVLLCLFHT